MTPVRLLATLAVLTLGPTLVRANDSGLTPAQLQQIGQLRAALQQLQQQVQTPPVLPAALPLQPGPGIPVAAVPSAPPAPEAPPPSKAAPPVGKHGHVRPDLPGPVEKIPIGTIAAGTLTMTVNSDYPGPWRGSLSQPIYSIDHSQLLFPEGSVIVGRVIRITGPNEAINNRLGLLPSYIVRPDGEAFPINQQAVLDQLGISGIADEVDYHLGVQLAAIGAFTAVNSLPEIAAAQGGGTTTVQGTFLQVTAQRGDVLLNRYLNLLPTVTIKAGTEFRVFFSEEMLAQVVRPRDRFELSNIGAAPQGSTP